MPQRRIHIATRDNSESLCGLRPSQCGTIGLQANGNCNRCLAHHRCHEGTATHENRLLLGRRGGLPENAALMFGPVEYHHKGDFPLKFRRATWRFSVDPIEPTHLSFETFC